MISSYLTNRLFIALFAGLLLAGCEAHVPSDKDIRLLTSKAWKYEQAGFNTDDTDQEESASFNALAPAISDYEKDNSVVFHPDGTGSDNLLPFTWSFQNNDSTIYFQDRYYKIKTLTSKKLIMDADQKQGDILTHYTIVLKH